MLYIYYDIDMYRGRGQVSVRDGVYSMYIVYVRGMYICIYCVSSCSV